MKEKLRLERSADALLIQECYSLLSMYKIESNIYHDTLLVIGLIETKMAADEVTDTCGCSLS